MLNRNSRITIRSVRAFTLVELLLVIGIIAVLMSLLLPAVAKVRIAGQKVATQGLINRISAACEAYFQDFNAYPGPFSDDQLVGQSPAGTISTQAPYIAGTGSVQLGTAAAPTTPLDHAPTSSENLFLGLCGGLRYNPTAAPQTFFFDPELALRSLGPTGLSATVAKRAQSYFQITQGDVSSNAETSNPLNDVTGPTKPGKWWATGNTGYTMTAPFVGDSEIFEFVDTFKNRRPILFMRAKRGVIKTSTPVAVTNKTGFLYVPNDTKKSTDPFQDNPPQIINAFSNTGRRAEVRYVTGGATVLDLTGKQWRVDILDYPAVRNDAGSLDKFNAGIERYFVNEQVSTGNPTAAGLNDETKVLVPQQRDKFILISAGPDGLYGTADDIRN